MKKIYSCLIILTFFASCANDENNREGFNLFSNKDGADILPANSTNAYDNAGRIYDQLFGSYYDGSSHPTDIQSVIVGVEGIANGNDLFNSVSQEYQPLSVERIQYLASRSNGDIASIIGVSSLSPNAKTSFINFLISITALYDSETDAYKMYSAIVKYEETVINSVLLSTHDQRLILTTTSIMRYTSYRAKKKPKANTDPYWAVWVTHVFGSEEGAEENMAKAIVEGLVTGIVSNK